MGEGPHDRHNPVRDHRTVGQGRPRSRAQGLRRVGSDSRQRTRTGAPPCPRMPLAYVAHLADNAYAAGRGFQRVDPARARSVPERTRTHRESMEAPTSRRTTIPASSTTETSCQAIQQWSNHRSPAMSHGGFDATAMTLADLSIEIYGSDGRHCGYESYRRAGPRVMSQ
jgi:hypothetical protein